MFSPSFAFSLLTTRTEKNSYEEFLRLALDEIQLSRARVRHNFTQNYESWACSGLAAEIFHNESFHFLVKLINHGELFPLLSPLLLLQILFMLLINCQSPPVHRLWSALATLWTSTRETNWMLDLRRKIFERELESIPLSLLWIGWVRSWHLAIFQKWTSSSTVKSTQIGFDHSNRMNVKANWTLNFSLTNSLARLLFGRSRHRPNNR